MGDRTGVRDAAGEEGQCVGVAERHHEVPPLTAPPVLLDGLGQRITVSLLGSGLTPLK